MSLVRDSHYERGIALTGAGSFAEAMAEFKLAIQEDPEHAMAHQELLLPFYREDNVRDAEASARRALELNPALAVAELALCLIPELDRDGEAEEHFERALSLRPDDKQ